MIETTPLDISFGTGQTQEGYINPNSLVLDIFKPYIHNKVSKFIIPKKVLNIMNNKQTSYEKLRYKMMKDTKEFVLNIQDLSQTMRVNLTKDYAKMLVDSCNLNLTILANKLSISYPFLLQLKNQKYSIPLNILSELSLLSGISLSEIQKNIVSIGSRAGIFCSVKFPIKENEILASLVGHVFGDGYVGRKKRQFEYSNTNPNLIKEVKNQISQLFNLLPLTEQQTRIGYPVIIGEILASFGSPIAPKIHSQNLVPEWITHKKEYKIAFLKAFFDDDGSVMYSKNYKAKGVNLYATRHIKYKDLICTLLEQISSMLKEFEIYSGKPKISRIYKKDDGMHVVMYINITDYQSMINFYNIIGLAKGNKLQKLETILTRKIFYMKGNERVIIHQILEFLSNKKAVSTAEIAKYVHKPRAKILKKMKLLQTKNKVINVGRVSSNRSYLWKIIGGENKSEKNQESNDLR